ncbi:hypothetical protein [Luteimonas terricola]|uniref:Uncharacterized protein n=1 Tax=Luteimonas terricola TaxID=645597 RepID=A0ABQ2EBD9_9GAMM|nr:hypothetical protein [Luteimonas terricola]GGK03651.1 hypothetical protein GCM10011394_10790 [Luteimonas terricola]
MAAASPGHTLPSPIRRPGSAMAARFHDFVAAPSFPCVGSKAALARGAIQMHEFAPLGDRANDASMLDARRPLTREPARG